MSRIMFPHQHGTAAQSPAGPAEPISAGPAALRPLPQGKRAISGAMLCSLILACLVVAACSPSISGEEAERAALAYVESRGIFYTRSAEGMSDVPDYALTVIQKEMRQGAWLVVIEASAEVNGTLKRANVRVAVDARTGEAAFLAQ